MLTRLLMSLLSDTVFDATATLRRSFLMEMDRYFAERGLITERKPERAAAR